MRFDGALALGATVACVCAAASQDANKGVSITLTADLPVRPRMTTRDAIASPAARSSVVVLSRLPPSPSPRRFLSAFSDALRLFRVSQATSTLLETAEFFAGESPDAIRSSWTRRRDPAVDCQAQIWTPPVPSPPRTSPTRRSVCLRHTQVLPPPRAFPVPRRPSHPRRRRRVARLSSGPIRHRRRRAPCILDSSPWGSPLRP